MFPSFPSLAAALSQPFKRSQLGLFHGKTKQYGNNVPFSKKKTRRSWLPNIQRKRLFSDALGEMVRVKLSTRALRTIRKCGGIDEYVLNTKSDLLGWEGMRLRVAVREAQERKASEASASSSAPGEYAHDIVFYFLRTAFYRLVNNPGIAKMAQAG